MEGLDSGVPSWSGEGRQNLLTFSQGKFPESSLSRASISGQGAAAGVVAEWHRLLPKCWKLPVGG